ncbi:MAG TPA: AMP-binding protein [Thermoanaerobaculia bacterium]|nr:AMP-binding protein [Thermoanaerobaculia bacterium]
MAALAAHAAANPADPCVVFPDQHGEWRWRSWRWLAARATAYAQALDGVPAGSAVGYPWRPQPEALAADLGIQAAGAVAVPASLEGGPSLPPLVRWLAIDGGEGPREVTAVTVAAEADAVQRHLGEDVTELPPLPAESRAPGTAGALVRHADAWLPWGERQAESAARALVRPPSARETRPIALVSGNLAAAPERAWIGWALAAGACLVLPGDAALAAWGLWWPRPTDACLPVESLAGLRALFASFGTPRRCRRQLARLQRLVVWGNEPASEEVAAWAELGVAVQRFPVKALR